MNIIFITKKGRNPHSIHLSRRSHYVLLLIAIVMLPVTIAGMGYWLGRVHAPESYVETWRAELADQRLAFEDLKETSQARTDALISRIGRMHGHITRLDALGAKLVKMANIEEDEFNFNEAPALGGPETLNALPSLGLVALDQAIKDLDQRMDSRSHQLVVLEEVLRDHNLHQETYPAGRPAKGWMSSNFGYRSSPFGRGGREFHKGIDIANREGTHIIAVAGGVVTWSDDRFGYGNLVEINHGNGYATRYGHNLKNLVQEGQTVKKGETIALMGSTGRSTGPHVHFEVVHNGRKIDPNKFIQN